jgi:hypothetical protein
MEKEGNKRYDDKGEKTEKGWGNIRKGPRGWSGKSGCKILCNDIFILMTQARSAL